MNTRPLMTFEDFRATGVDVASVQEEMGFNDGNPAKPGRIYLNACYIEREPDGRWFCIVSNEDEISTELEDVERFLFARMDGELYIAVSVSPL